MPRITAPDILKMKGKGEKIAMLTAYDYPMAKMADAAGVDMVLVGDSLGMVIQGQPDTLRVTLRDMIYHGRCVAAGLSRAHLTVDMPFMSYQVGPRQALRNAGRLVKEGLAQSVKIEGGVRSADAVKMMVDAGIPVVGHIGLTPQSVNAMGGFKVQAREREAAVRLVAAAKELQHAGCFAIVLEGIPDEVAAMVTDALDVPTIGIGAGPRCDGQVLVMHDLLGIEDRVAPKFVRRYADVKGLSVEAIRSFAGDVRDGSFPSAAESYHLSAEQAEQMALYGAQG